MRLTLDQVDRLNDHELSLLFTEGGTQVPVSSARYDSLEALFPELEKQLKRKGITRQHLWEQYRRDHPGGYGRSHFNHLLQDYIGRSQPVMHIEHKAGDKLFIDFAGDRLHLADPHTGEAVPVEVFVAILGCSQLTYVQAVMSQKRKRKT